jgi:very-short-patch-repair endonuclease
MRAPVLTLKRARTLRRKMTLPEVLLWERIRGGRLNGLRFRRQHPIGPYILDFYCASARLAVEIDGAVHDHQSQWTHDKRRNRWLGENHISVLRTPATEILNDEAIEALLASIAQAATPSTAGVYPRAGLRPDPGGGPPPPRFARRRNLWRDC